MAGLETSLGEIERMLELRRVPLFERLDPEDLQRVAAAANERSFAPGATLVTEGEVGNELFVILEDACESSVSTRMDRSDRSGHTNQAITSESWRSSLSGHASPRSSPRTRCERSSSAVTD